MSGNVPVIILFVAAYEKVKFTLVNIIETFLKIYFKYQIGIPNS